VTIQKNEEIQNLRTQLAKAEEKLRKDQMELKLLKDEIQHLKFLVDEGKSNENI
jgi:hypothetical protein